MPDVLIVNASPLIFLGNAGARLSRVLKRLYSQSTSADKNAIIASLVALSRLLS
jgi:hypothetical protein